MKVPIRSDLSATEALRLWRLAGLPRNTKQYGNLYRRARLEQNLEFRIQHSEANWRWRKNNTEHHRDLCREWRENNPRRVKKLNFIHRQHRLKSCDYCGIKWHPGMKHIRFGICARCRIEAA